MQIEILHIDECPNWVEAGALVRSVLQDCGLTGVDIRYRLVHSSEDAARVPFAGSPTILIDGVDAFPTDGRTTDLACRVYFTGERFAGLPTRGQLLDVLRHRRA